MRGAEPPPEACPGYRQCALGLIIDCWSASPWRGETCFRAAADDALAAIPLPPDLAAEYDELVQDVMIRAVGDGGVGALARVRRATCLRTWLRGIARSCVRERLRDRMRARRARPRTLRLDALGGVPCASRTPTPAEMAALREALERVRSYPHELPPPNDVIAAQLARGLDHRTIIDFLRSWRPVGREECRRLIKRTKAMLRALEAGEDPRSVWPAGWSRRRNPWSSLPPPPPEKSLVL